jgi:phosphoglycerol transferase MdoB-like AlkP superfamily enzyme
MKRQDNRQILGMLATSVLILCVLHPYPGYICMGLESLICLLLFSVLILFIAKQAAALYNLVLASALCFAGFVFVDTARRQLIEDVSADTFSIGDPILPFRFQLPPPALSA